MAKPELLLQTSPKDSSKSTGKAFNFLQIIHLTTFNSFHPIFLPKAVDYLPINSTKVVPFKLKDITKSRFIQIIRSLG